MTVDSPITIGDPRPEVLKLGIHFSSASSITPRRRLGVFLQVAEEHAKWGAAIVSADYAALADEHHRHLSDSGGLQAFAISLVIASG